MEHTSSTVGIIGCGPVGLYTALLLAQASIDVTVFEAETAVMRIPKAAGYFPIVHEGFKRVGIYDDLAKIGLHANGMAWRKPMGELIAYLPIRPPHITLQLEQYDFADVILDHLAPYNNATIKFQHDLVQIDQCQDEVTATFESGPSKVRRKHICRYLIGADGGKSTVRKSLNIPFDGFTYDDFNLVTIQILYPLESHGEFSPANFYVDPDLWAVVVKTKDYHWRVTYPEPVIESQKPGWWDEDAMLMRARNILPKLLPGPTQEAKITRIAWYKMHQRCATRFVDGNVILAGDSAHLTNPIGGLGLTSGLLDASFLGPILTKILTGGCDAESLLEQYNRKRRTAFLEYTSPTAMRNRDYLASTDPKVRKEAEVFFERVKKPDLAFFKSFGEAQQKLVSTLD